jgi:hypothetical protein
MPRDGQLWEWGAPDRAAISRFRNLLLTKFGDTPSGNAERQMDLSFTKHPSDVGESYAEHFVVATSFGSAMILGGLACLVHGVLPFLFTSTGSSTIKRLHERMVVSRRRVPAEGAALS